MKHLLRDSASIFQVKRRTGLMVAISTWQISLGDDRSIEGVGENR